MSPVSGHPTGCGDASTVVSTAREKPLESGWDSSLKQLMDAGFLALHQEMNLRFSAIDRAQDLAARTLEARLEGMNEFREQIQQERGEYVRVSVFENRAAELARRLNFLEKTAWTILGGLSLLVIVVEIGVKLIK